jgi:hypothetical protein
MTYAANKRAYNEALRNYEIALENRRRGMARARAHQPVYPYYFPQANIHHNVVTQASRLANAYKAREAAYYKLLHKIESILKEHGFNQTVQNIKKGRELANEIMMWAPGMPGAERLRRHHEGPLYRRAKSAERQKPKTQTPRRAKSLQRF